MIHDKVSAVLQKYGKKLSQREENLAELLGWQGLWRRVYICAPFDGRDTRSHEKLWWYCKFALEHGCIPVAPDMYYPEFMHSEFSEHQKELARRFALKDVSICREIWVFGDKLTPDIKKKLQVAVRYGINVRLLPDWDIIRDLKLEEGGNGNE